MPQQTSLGLVTLTGLVIANMIGAGVFTTSGFALGDLGSPVQVMAAWFIGGCLATCGALSYGALSKLIPVSGGEYLFLSRNVHPLAGFIAGWISLLAGFTGAIAYAAITFEIYVVPESLKNELPDNVVATLAIMFAAVFHGIRVRYGSLIQNFSVGLKLLLIGLFILYVLFGPSFGTWEGLRHYRHHAAEAPPFSITAFALTLMWISFSFSGFNAAIYVASEVKQAVTVIPRAMFIATLITTLIYILLNGIFVFAPGPDLISYKQDVAAITAKVLGGESLESIIRIIIAVALFTSISAMIMVGPRVYAQMAEDGFMPRALRITRDTPDISIAIQALLAVIVVWMTGLRELLSYLGFALGLSAAATVASLFILVRRVPVTERELPGYPWAPLIFVSFTLLFAGMAAIRNPREMLAALITILSGMIIYYLVKIFQSAPSDTKKL